MRFLRTAALCLLGDQAEQSGLELLDRLAESRSRARPRAAFSRTTLDDGSEALLVDGGGIDGGTGGYFANAGEDVHAVGSLDPIVPATSAAS
jgi:hypothetical protein